MQYVNNKYVYKQWTNVNGGSIFHLKYDMSHSAFPRLHSVFGWFLNLRHMPYYQWSDISCSAHIVQYKTQYKKKIGRLYNEAWIEINEMPSIVGCDGLYFGR